MAVPILTICIALFLGVHLIPMVPAWRAAVVGRLGETVYKVAFSVIAAIGLVGAIVAYRFAPHEPLWTTPVPLRMVTMVLMLLAILCFVGAKQSIWFRRIVRHPMLWGIGLLGIAHILANGEVPGLILFGGLALFGFAWQPMIDRRDAIVDPQGWAVTERTTSLWPFARWRALGDAAPAVTIKPLLIGLVAFVVLILAHPYLFGASVVPQP
jgi:uncharacterized membrane protein